MSYVTDNQGIKRKKKKAVSGTGYIGEISEERAWNPLCLL